MSNKLVGYRIKKTLKMGDIVASTDGIYEPIYEPKQPLEEVADIAYAYAYLKNDPELSERIDELVDGLNTVEGAK